MHWQKSYEIGHEKIDMEHRVFVEIISSIQELETTSASRAKIRRTVAELVKYAEFHFISEENIMLDCEYPDFEAHRQQHETLIRALNLKIVKFETGELQTGDLVDFTSNWFLNHTAKDDTKLSKYISQNLKPQ